MNRANAQEFQGLRWQHGLLALLAFGSLGLMLSLPVIRQDAAYHLFADRRVLCGVPNFWDVASNLPFLLVGIAGLMFCLGSSLRAGRSAWLVLFGGVSLVSIGSGVYHWNPGDATLVWDRLPMTIAFMGLFVALLAEYVHARLGDVLLVPMLLLGLFSVLYWERADDLRLYIWVQLFPLLTIPAVMLLFRARYTHSWLLAPALGLYVLAKLAEIYDREFFALTGGAFSGHSLKHVLAAAGCFTILWMLRARKPV
ncbi:MAG TPA: hypothetical protein VEF92_03280 [Burkholderiales bacterium]|nr:hypothetical protein [Burkholderiales bacterium]